MGRKMKATINLPIEGETKNLFADTEKIPHFGTTELLLP